MNRRTVIAGLGSLTASSTLAVGTGAFTSVSAERSITIETAQDSDALLKLDALGEAERSRAGNTVEFEFPSLREQERDELNPQNPQGLGTDSVYRFASDVNGSNGLFRITNQGTQSIDVYSTQAGSTDSVPEVDIFAVENGEVLLPDDPYTELGTGESLRLGFEIDTSDVDVRDDPYEVTLQIVGEATESD